MSMKISGRGNLAKLIDIPHLQRLTDSLYAASGIPIGIISPEGEILVGAGWQDICVKFHRAHPESAKLCLESDQYINSRMLDGEFIEYKCKNHLWDMGIPIIAGGIHLANLYVGQFFYEGEERSRELFRRQAKKYGFDEAAYLDALDRVPVFSREKVKAIKSYYVEFARLLAEMAQAKTSLTDVREKLEERIEERTESLRETVLELEKTSNALAEREEWQRTLFDEAPDPIFLADTETGIILDANVKACELLKKQKSDIVGIHQSQLHPPNRERHSREVFETHGKTGSGVPVQGHVIRSDGVEVPVEVVSQLIHFGGRAIVQGIFRDVTERVWAEREIQLQRDNFMRILGAVTDGIYIVSRNYDIEYVNPVIEREFGKVEGRKCYAYFHDRKDVCPWCKNEDVFKGKSVRWEWSSSKTGKTYDLLDTPIMNPDGSVSKFEIFHDITERKRIEDALSESEERYRSLFENSHAVLLVINPDDGAIVDANPAAVAYYGWTREELRRKKISDINTLTPDQVRAEMELARTEKRNHFLFKHRQAHGEPRDVEVYSGPIKIHGRDLLYSIIFDITERKIAEDALRQRTTDLGERVKELNCLYGVSKIIAEPDKSIYEVLEESVHLIPPAWFYPEITCARITFEGWEVATDNFREAPWKLSSAIVIAGKAVGAVDVCYLEEKPAVDEGPFLKEERDLIEYLSRKFAVMVERKRADTALRQSDALLNATQHMTKVGGWEYDVEKQSIYWTDEVYRIHDLDPAEIAKGSTDHIPRSVECYAPEDRPVILGAFTRCAQEGIPYDMELPFTTTKGRKLWVNTRAKPVFDKGKIVRVIGNITDITERKQAEEKLAKSEERFRLLSENASDLIYHVRLVPDFGFDYVSPSAERLVGYTPEEHYADPYLGMKIVHPDDRALLQSVTEQRLFNQTVELRWIHKDGHLVWMEQVNHPVYGKDGALVGITGAARDITERKRTEEKLKYSELWLQNIYNSLDEAVLVVTPDRKLVKANRATELMFGYSEEELRFLSTEILHVDREHYVEFGRRMQEAFNKGEVASFEYEFKRRNGEVFPTEHSISLLKDNDGKTLGIVSVCRDITARKRVEEALRQNEELLRNYFDLGQVGMAITSLDQKWLKVNDRLCEILGYTKDELTRMTWTELTHPDDMEPDLAQFRRLLSGEIERYAMDKRFIHKSGNIVHTHLTVACQRKPDRSVEYIIASVIDITERKQAEEAVRQSAETLNRAQSIAQTGSWVLDIPTSRLEWSVETCRMFGFPQQKVVDLDTFASAVHPDDREYVFKAWGEAMAGTSYDIEHRIVVNGETRWVRERAQVEYDSEGLPITGIGSVQDITERKRAEEALRDSENFMKSVLEFMPLGVWILNAKGELVFGNPAAQEIWAGKRLVPIDQLGEYKGWRHEDGKQIEPHGWAGARALEKGETSINEEIIIQCFDGTKKIIFDSAAPIRDADGRIKGAVTVNQDITERKRVEEQLRLVSIYTRNLIETSLDPLVTISADGKITDVNSATEKVTGLPRDKIIGTDFSSYFTEPEKADAGYRQVFKEGYVTDYPLAIRHSSGEITDVLYNASVYRNEKGEVAGVFAAARDITERKRAELALAQSELNYRTVADFTNDWETWRNPDGRFRYVSPSCERITGYPAERFISEPDLMGSIIHPQDIDVYNNHFETSHTLAGSGRIKEREPDRVLFRIIRKDGAARWIEHVCQRVFDEKGAWMGTRGSNRDITELIEAREQAELATKLKDQFVSLVAHDLRSPFTSMMGLLRHFVERKPVFTNEEDQKVLDAVFKSGDRMMTMIDQLLKISRLQTGKITPQPRFFKGHTAVAVTISALSHNAAQKGIEIINDVPVDLRLYADQSLFDEVLLNLLSNAIKFCSRGDKITFFTPPGLKSAIAIRDTGKGVSEKIIPNIFRHEVRTSTLGTAGEMGTGLGMPYSYDIMKAHGGEIKVEATPGKGSVFYALLPYVRAVALVVDDEPMSLLLARSHLEKIGIEVIEALNAEKALEIARVKRPHIIIADIMMPGMDGFALIDRLKQDKATGGIPVIVMTSADGDVREKAFRHGADDFVSKPIEAQDFIPRVRRFVG